MPKAKYKKESATGLYFTHVPTGEVDAKGHQKYKKIRAKTVALLDTKVKEYQQEQTLHLERKKITVDEWYRQWMETYKSGCKPTTQTWYSTIYHTHISPIIGHMQLSDVRETHCQKILSLSADKAQKTQKAIRTAMVSLFEKAERNRLIAYNPAKFTATPTNGKPPKQRRSLTPEEREAYLQTCKTHPFGTFAAFLFYLGLRRGECLALTANDIKQDTIVISKQYTFPGNNMPALSTPKTKAGIRELPIPHGLRPYIASCKAKNGLLFTSENGFPLTYSQVIDRWKNFITTALGRDTDITMHYVRHNYCTMLFEQGVDIMTAQYLMGHDDIETTMKIYTHYTEEMKRKNLSAVLTIGNTTNKKVSTQVSRKRTTDTNTNKQINYKNA